MVLYEVSIKQLIVHRYLISFVSNRKAKAIAKCAAIVSIVLLYWLVSLGQFFHLMIGGNKNKDQNNTLLHQK